MSGIFGTMRAVFAILCFRATDLLFQQPRARR